MSHQTKWVAGLYTRLSKDDRDKDVSNSIGNQKEMLLDFVEKHDDISVGALLVDDGFTGANYQRSGFQQLIRHIEDGDINCVIVKDLSRLGRDHIETGKYIERYFAEKDVRFIAINDNYDSLKADMTDSSNRLIVPFKNIMNEAFLEDISVKTRTHLEIKRKNGEFIGNYAVYGYMKTAGKKLVPDDYAADVVRSVYAFKIGGFNEKQIADALDAKGVLPPAEYKKARGVAYYTPFAVKERPKWSTNAIRRILTNRVYIGCLEQGKRSKASYRMAKYTYKPREEWVIHENAHEAIVSESDFQIVQELMQKDTRVSATGQIQPLSGFLICGKCGRPMTMRTVKKNEGYIYFICSTHKKTGGCKNNNVSARAIEQYILASIQAHISSTISMSDLDGEFGKDTLHSRKHLAIEGMIEKQLQTIESNKNFLVKAYEHFVGGDVTQEEYKMFKCSFTRQIEAAESSIAALKDSLDNLNDSARSKELVERFKHYENITTLDREVVANFIQSIIVHDNKNIAINFRYSIGLAEGLEMGVG